MSSPTANVSELERAPLTGRTKLFAIGALAVALAAFGYLALGGLGDNLVYYWQPSDLIAAGDKAYGATIRLGGVVAPGSIERDERSTRMKFKVTDGTQLVAVNASGMPPQMFREDIGVIVEGTMGRDGVFTSNKLMVSHGNEYRPPAAGEKVDVEQMYKQMVKNGGDKPANHPPMGAQP